MIIVNTIATMIAYWLGFGLVIATTLWALLQFAKLCEFIVDHVIIKLYNRFYWKDG